MGVPGRAAFESRSRTGDGLGRGSIVAVVTVLALVGVAAVLFLAAVLATSDQPVLADAPPDRADLPLPDSPVQPEDVAAVRFSLAPRGYRMAEVDEVLARLGAELADRDRRLALLEATVVGQDMTPGAAAPPVPLEQPVAVALPVPPAQPAPPEPPAPEPPAVTVATTPLAEPAEPADAQPVEEPAQQSISPGDDLGSDSLHR